MQAMPLLGEKTRILWRVLRVLEHAVVRQTVQLKVKLELFESEMSARPG